MACRTFHGETGEEPGQRNMDLLHEHDEIGHGSSDESDIDMKKASTKYGELPPPAAGRRHPRI